MSHPWEPSWENQKIKKSISTGQAIPSKDGVGDERHNTLFEKKQAGIDLSHPHDRVGDERHNTLFEQR